MTTPGWSGSKRSHAGDNSRWFSGWLSIYSAGKGEFDGKTLENILRDYFTNFNIPQEFASEGGGAR